MKAVDLKKISDDANNLDAVIAKLTKLTRERAEAGDYSVQDMVSPKITPYLKKHFEAEGFTVDVIVGFSPIIKISWG